MRVVKQKEKQLEEAARAITQAKRLVESKQDKIQKLEESAQRKAILGELLGPLSGEKRRVMSELLESVRTPRLHSAYEKYLPAVMDGGKPAKRALTEGKEVTGNRQAKQPSSESKTAEIYDIRRLAGL